MSIKTQIVKLQKQGIDSNSYYLINSKDMQETLNIINNDKEKIKCFYNLCESWDTIEDTIPLEIGVSIENLVHNPDNAIAIHRSSVVTGLIDENLKSIMMNGLRNDAQLSQGATHEIPDLTKSLSFVSNMFHAIPMLKSSYKGSNGSIIFSFPIKYVSKEGNIMSGYENQIYQENNGIYYIKPEFIVGYLVSEYGVYNLYTKEEILEKMQNKNMY